MTQNCSQNRIKSKTFGHMPVCPSQGKKQWAEKSESENVQLLLWHRNIGHVQKKTTQNAWVRWWELFILLYSYRLILRVPFTNSNTLNMMQKLGLNEDLKNGSLVEGIEKELSPAEPGDLTLPPTGEVY